jgi:5-hydroxyisourate hydrolase-like protein (transthyretin family)
MSDHVWALENIAAYLAGGLDPAEGERLEQHAAGCETCARAMEEARDLERRLAPLFRNAKPGLGLEDRIIRAMPATPATTVRRRAFTLSWRAKCGLAVAASLLLAFIGWGVSKMIEDDRLNFSGSAANNLKQIRLATHNTNDVFKRLPPGVGSFPRSPSDGTVKQEIVDGSYSMKTEEILKSAEDMAKDIRISNLDKLEKPQKEVSEKLDSETKKQLEINQPKQIDSPEGKKPVDDKSKVKIDPDAGTLLPLSIPAFWHNGKLGLPNNGGFGAGGAMGMMGGSMMGNMPTGPVPPGYFSTSEDTKKGDKGKNDKGTGTVIWSYTNKGPASLPPIHKGFFKPGEEIAQFDPRKKLDKGEDGDKSTAKNGGGGEKAPGQGKEDGKKEPKGKFDDTGVKKPELPPQVTPRKIIIRSGDMEFEVDSFDTSLTTIMKLVTASKGGFVATINSDKLANGKVRGSIVVRMPPDQLDQFILDLRKELAKAGELKNQRLGSEDITKQYMDLESRLRAARTMEQRLLNIIKEGKGQIKDLLQAEKELGVWRTKIEEMEGELRYYSNLVSLATLTIKLYEKDIRTAALITENERVQAGIEVEDVEKAHKEALKAILDAKGRISRSELKQHAAGQFNAILNFEVSPDAAGPLRDRLKQIGHMVRLQIDRMQQTSNGGPAPKDGKVKRGDSQFFISIYNLANVAPRETIILRIAAADVPAVYLKLREAIAKAKGHVVNANLDEKDRQNINAQIDFNVRRAGQAEIQAVLTALGETLSRQVSRVPDSDNVTDSKVMYRLALVDADSIQPRETVTILIAATDVRAAYEKLTEAFAKAKARVINAKLDERDRRNIVAQLEFTFHRKDEGVVQIALKAAGETLARNVTRLPESPNLTDTKVFVRLDLILADALPPRETVTLKVAAKDVAAAYESLRTAVTKAKGRVTNALLNEQDQLNITAVVNFDVPRDDDAAIQAVLTAAGKTLSRKVDRQSENLAVTDTKIGFKVELIQADGLSPRETVTLKFYASDVPGTYQKLRDAVSKAKGRITGANLNEQDRRNITAKLEFDIPKSEENALQAILAGTGETQTRQDARHKDDGSVTDAKVRFKIDLLSADTISPRKTTILGVEVSDVFATLRDFNSQVNEVQGRTVKTNVGLEKNGQVTARVMYDVPLSTAASLVEKFKAAGLVRADTVEEDQQAPEGKLALGRIILTLSNAELLVPPDKGLWSTIRGGLSFSLRGLAYSASLLIVGLLFVLPWAILLYVAFVLVRRMMRHQRLIAATPEAPSGNVPTAPAG